MSQLIPSGPSFRDLIAELVPVFGSAKVNVYATLIVKTQSHYPFLELPETLASWLEEWLEIERQYGSAVFQTALSHTKRESEKFPHPVAIRQSCSGVVAAQQAGKALEDLRRHDQEARANPGAFIEMAKDPDWIAFCERYAPRLKRSATPDNPLPPAHGKEHVSNE